MTLPTYKIEVAFNAGVTTPAASRTWTDVSAYVLLDAGMDITYGRGDWRSTADANTLKLTLNNSDGRFTAGLTTSPYYPNVKLGRPIRVTATVGGVSSVRFVGFVDEWPLEWPASVSTFATAQITASSRSAWLAEGTELRSIVEEEILADGPWAYYTLGEPSGATKAADGSIYDRAMLAPNGSGITFGTATGPTTDSLTAASFTGAGQFTLSAASFTGGDGPIGILFPYYAIEFFISTSATPGSLSAIANFVDSQINVDTSGRVTCGSITGPVINDGKVHHIALTTDISAVTRLYVDGTLAGTGTATGAVYVSSLTIGPVGFAAVLSHVAIYFSTALTNAARITAHANAGLNGFAGETPAARITRYASYANIAATELSFDTGQVPSLTHLDTTGSDALDMMRKIEATEEGILFDKADGTLAFHDRAHRYSGTPSFVLDVTQGHVSPGMEPRLDRTTIRNDVSSQSSDGTLSARITNSASLAAYGLARESLDLATSNADEVYEHAAWLVSQYAEPQPRVPSLVVDLANPNVTTTLSQSVLAAAVSTRFTVKGMPSQAAATQQDYIVEGYSESIGEARHSITFNISQAQPYDVFTIGDPVLGQYDAYPIAL